MFLYHFIVHQKDVKCYVGLYAAIEWLNSDWFKLYLLLMLFLLNNDDMMTFVINSWIFCQGGNPRFIVHFVCGRCSFVPCLVCFRCVTQNCIWALVINKVSRAYICIIFCINNLRVFIYLFENSYKMTRKITYYVRFIVHNKNIALDLLHSRHVLQDKRWTFLVQISFSSILTKTNQTKVNAKCCK